MGTIVMKNKAELRPRAPLPSKLPRRKPDSGFLKHSCHLTHSVATRPRTGRVEIQSSCAINPRWSTDASPVYLIRGRGFMVLATNKVVFSIKCQAIGSPCESINCCIVWYTSAMRDCELNRLGLVWIDIQLLPTCGR